MSQRNRTLTAKQVKLIITNLGFRYRNTEGSHEQWVRDEPPPFRKVTVDSPQSPFRITLIKSMSRQAGVSLKDFYKALEK